jgi:hypothetical protein
MTFGQGKTPFEHPEKNTLDLQVVLLVTGPCDGERAEAPKNYSEIWRCGTDGRYHEYKRLNAAMFSYAGRSLSVKDFAQHISGQGGEPYLHMDEAEPAEHRQSFTKFRADAET